MTRRTSTVLSFVPLLFFIFEGCVGSHSRSSDGNSKWLHECETENDCDGPRECLCGVCTTACVSTAGCEDEQASCEDTGGAKIATVCTAESVSGASRICMLPCQDKRDCESRNDELVCREGLCVHPDTSGSESDGGALEHSDAGTEGGASLPPEDGGLDGYAIDGGIDADSVDAESGNGSPVPAPGTIGGPCIVKIEYASEDGFVPESEPYVYCNDNLVCGPDDRCRQLQRCKGIPQVACILGTLPEGAEYYALDETKVYWSSRGTKDYLGNYQHDGRLLTRSFSDGEPIEVLTGLEEPDYVYVDNEHVFFRLKDKTFWSVSKSQGGIPHKLIDNINIDIRPYRITSDATHLYFVKLNPTTPDRLLRIVKDGSQPAERIDHEVDVNGVVIDEKDIYFDSYRGIYRRVKTGGAITLITEEHGDAWLAVSKDYVVYNISSTRIWRVAKSTGDSLIIGKGRSGWLKTRNDVAYWCNEPGNENTRVMRAPIDMSAAQGTLIEMNCACKDIYFKDQGLYWIESGQILHRPW